MAQACWPADTDGEAGILQISFAVRGESDTAAAAPPPEQSPMPQAVPPELQPPRQEVAIGA